MASRYLLAHGARLIDVGTGVISGAYAACLGVDLRGYAEMGTSVGRYALIPTNDRYAEPAAHCFEQGVDRMGSTHDDDGRLPAHRYHGLEGLYRDGFGGVCGTCFAAGEYDHVRATDYAGDVFRGGNCGLYLTR